MKSEFIFILILPTLLWSCGISKPVAESQVAGSVQATAQYWYANPDSDSNFTERGVDLILELQNMDASLTPEYIIFEERKSFPATFSLTDEGMLTVQARIILESALLQQISGKTTVPDRLVLINEEGDKSTIEISEWKILPNRYD